MIKTLTSLITLIFLAVLAVGIFFTGYELKKHPDPKVLVKEIQESVKEKIDNLIKQAKGNKQHSEKEKNESIRKERKPSTLHKKPRRSFNAQKRTVPVYSTPKYNKNKRDNGEDSVKETLDRLVKKDLQKVKQTPLSELLKKENKDGRSKKKTEDFSSDEKIMKSIKELDNNQKGKKTEIGKKNDQSSEKIMKAIKLIEGLGI